MIFIYPPSLQKLKRVDGWRKPVVSIRKKLEACIFSVWKLMTKTFDLRIIYSKNNFKFYLEQAGRRRASTRRTSSFRCWLQKISASF
jgi:hypothetical protein